MRRLLLKLMIGLGTIVGIIWVLLFIREQNYYQLADYTQFSSKADVQAYLDQKLQEGKSTEAEVVSFIMQSGIASTISSDSNCRWAQSDITAIGCTVRAPVIDYSKNSRLPQISNLGLEYYYIWFELKDTKLKLIRVSFYSSWDSAYF